MRRLPATLLVVLLAVVATVGLRYGAETLAMTVAWARAGLGLVVEPFGTTPILAMRFVPWVAAGFLPALALTVLALSDRTRRARWLRILAGVAVVANLALAGGCLWAHLPLHAGFAALSAGAAGVVAAGRLPRAGAAAPILAAVALLLIGRPAIELAWADLTQKHQPFVLELDAAYPTQPGVTILAPAPQYRTIDGVEWEIARGDALRFTEADIGYVHRDGDVITFHITSGAKAAELARRSYHRISQHDALVLNGHDLAVPLYNNVLLEGAVALDLRGHADELWRALAPP